MCEAGVGRDLVEFNCAYLIDVGGSEERKRRSYNWRIFLEYILLFKTR